AGEARGARKERGRDADLQEHRNAPRPARRSRGAEEGARGAQGNPHDPREVDPEAGEVPVGAVRGSRGQDSIRARHDALGRGEPLNSLPITPPQILISAGLLATSWPKTRAPHHAGSRPRRPARAPRSTARAAGDTLS